MATTTREEAKNAVREIAKRYGYLNEDMMQQMEIERPEWKRMIEEAFLAKDKLAGSSIIALAKNIYGSDARFFFELLQNADDNQYNRAGAAVPSFSFEVYSDRIVIENNEDGFNTDNLEAICAIDKSTKIGATGYIGAKGIGFKSVFIVAWKVDIQSGPFTFSFKHEKDGTGMGMVLPIWNDNAEFLFGPITRVTLHLHGGAGSDERIRLRGLILDQLSDLKETCLLFLRKIKAIKITIHDEYNTVTSNKTLKVTNQGQYRVALETQDHLEETLNKMYYHVTEHNATGVPNSDNRPVNASSSTTKIILAFPTSENLSPIIDNQHIFAFLPVRESGFKFLIHSDFDTNASRQDVVRTSRRNTFLRDHVAYAFVEAALQFCELGDQCYTWPKYLPQPENTLDPFWSFVRDKLQNLIKTTPCLRSRHKEYLRKPGDIKRIATDAVDEDSGPLLDNSSLDPYPSSQYSDLVLTHLKAYGLEVMSVGLFITLLEKDLKSDRSKMKSSNTTDAWHTAAACLLSKHESWKDRLVTLTLLPLRDGQWITAQRTAYFSYTREFLIPDQVGMLILDPRATSNQSRKGLFGYLGVKTAEPSQVRLALLALYLNPSFQPRSLAISRDHLGFLYLTHSSRQFGERMEDFRVFSREGSMLSARQLFLPSNEPLSPETLLVSVDGSTHYEAHFIHSTYLENHPEPGKVGIPAWKRWLVDTLKLRERLTIVSEDGTKLSNEWHFVYLHHPGKALRLLQSVWSFERTRIMANQELMEEIKKLRANPFCESDLERDLQLSSAWLPLPGLVETAQHYLDSLRDFPFLDLEDDNTLSEGNMKNKWSFLSRDIGVNERNNHFFLVELVYWIRSASLRRSRVIQPQLETLFGIYTALESHCVTGFSAGAVGNIIHRFTRMPLILVGEGSSQQWTCPQDCLWKGPVPMKSKISLEPSYRVRAEESQFGMLQSFFQRRLKVLDATFQDVVGEFDHRQKNMPDDEQYDDILTIFHYLNNMTLSIEDKASLRSSFLSKPLIYRQSNAQRHWYRSDECLWASTTAIRGRVTLNDHYEELENFFVETIGVQRLTIQMLFDQLCSPDLSPNVEDVKEKLWAFNDLIFEEGSYYQDPAPILSAKIFPVSYPGGRTSLVSAGTEFAVADRESLAELFRGQLKLLDFDLEEIHRLRPFLSWTGIYDRYLSTLIRSVTSVAPGDEHPVTRRDRNIKYKAHGLLRIAATFKSPRYLAGAQRLYEMLRNTEIISTSSISSTLQISQDGKSFEAGGDVASLHIHETGQAVKIYVPRSRKQQEFCFNSLLPKHFADWLMLHPDTQIPEGVENQMILALTTLFACHTSVCEQVLESGGIIQVPTIMNVDEPDSDLDTESDYDERNDALIEPDGANGVDEPHTDNRQPGRSLHEATDESNSSESPADEEFYPAWSTTVVAHSAAARAATGGNPVYVDPQAQHDHRYTALLQRVTAAARRAGFPDRGAFDMRALRMSLQVIPNNFINFDGVDHFQAGSQFDRNFKIGAAGELYVFELFSSLELPGWSSENWQSTIRDRITSHPDYTDLPAWHGREQADLMYDDSRGALTAILIDHGHLPGIPEWQNARPRYLLEVKTTTGPDHTPFFISKGQYRMIQDKHRVVGFGTAAVRDVYIVLRVYEIDGDGIGMSVYIDPEQLRADNELVFKAEKWAVVPGLRNAAERT